MRKIITLTVAYGVLFLLTLDSSDARKIQIKQKKKPGLEVNTHLYKNKHSKTRHHHGNTPSSTLNKRNTKVSQAHIRTKLPASRSSIKSQILRHTKTKISKGHIRNTSPASRSNVKSQIQNLRNTQKHIGDTTLASKSNNIRSQIRNKPANTKVLNYILGHAANDILKKSRTYKRSRQQLQEQRDTSYDNNDLSSDLFGFSEQAPIRMDDQRIDDKTPIGRAGVFVDPFSDMVDEPNVNQYAFKPQEDSTVSGEETAFDSSRKPMENTQPPTAISHHHTAASHHHTAAQLSLDEKERMKSFLHATDSDIVSDSEAAANRNIKKGGKQPLSNPFAYLNLPATQSVEIQPKESSVSSGLTEMELKSDSAKKVNFFQSDNSPDSPTANYIPTEKPDETAEVVPSSVIDVKEMSETDTTSSSRTTEPGADNKKEKNKNNSSSFADDLTTTITNNGATAVKSESETKPISTATELPFVITSASRDSDNSKNSKKESGINAPSSLSSQTPHVQQDDTQSSTTAGSTTTTGSTNTTLTRSQPPSPLQQPPQPQPQQVIDIKDPGMHLSIALNSTENQDKYIEKLENVIKLVKGMKNDAPSPASVPTQHNDAEHLQLQHNLLPTTVEDLLKIAQQNLQAVKQQEPITKQYVAKEALGAGNNTKDDNYSYITHQGKLYKVLKVEPEKEHPLSAQPTEQLKTLDDQLSKMVMETANSLTSSAKSDVLSANDYLLTPSDSNKQKKARDYQSPKISSILGPKLKNTSLEFREEENESENSKTDKSIDESKDKTLRFGEKLLSELNDDKTEHSADDDGKRAIFTATNTGVVPSEFVYEDDENQTENVPTPKKKTKTSKITKSVTVDEKGDDEDDEEENDEEEKSKKKKVVKMDENEDSDDEKEIEEEEEEYEDDDKNSKKKRKKRRKNRRKRKKIKHMKMKYSQEDDDEGSGEDQKEDKDMSIHMLHKAKGYKSRMKNDSGLDGDDDDSDNNESPSQDEAEGVVEETDADGPILALLQHHHNHPVHHESTDVNEAVENESESDEGNKENIKKKKLKKKRKSTKKSLRKHIQEYIKERKIKQKNAAQFLFNQANHRYKVNMRALDKTGHKEKLSIKSVPKLKTRVFAEKISTTNALAIKPGYTIKTFIDPAKRTKTFEIRHNDRLYRVVQPVQITEQRGYTRELTPLPVATPDLEDHEKGTITELNDMQLPDNGQQTSPQLAQVVDQQPSLSTITDKSSQIQTQTIQSLKENMLAAFPLKTQQENVVNIADEPLKDQQVTPETASSIQQETNLVDTSIQREATPMVASFIQQEVTPIASSLQQEAAPMIAPSINSDIPASSVADIQSPIQTVYNTETLLPPPSDASVQLIEQYLTNSLNQNTPPSSNTALAGTRKEKVPATSRYVPSHKPSNTSAVQANTRGATTTAAIASTTLSQEIKGVTSLSSSSIKESASSRKPTVVNDEFTKTLNQDIVLK